MKYLLIIPAESLAEPLAILAIKTEVNIVPGSSGWHLTVLPPFELTGEYSDEEFAQIFAGVMLLTLSVTLKLGGLRFHPEGTRETWVISAEISAEHEEWLEALSTRCLWAIEPLLVEPLTIYPPHFTFSKGWGKKLGLEAYGRLKPAYEQRSLSFVADHTALLRRENKEDPWTEVCQLGFR